VCVVIRSIRTDIDVSTSVSISSNMSRSRNEKEVVDRSDVQSVSTCSSLRPCLTSPPPSQLFIRVPSFLQHTHTHTHTHMKVVVVSDCVQYLMSDSTLGWSIGVVEVEKYHLIKDK
jgi:hypothetical protein